MKDIRRLAIQFRNAIDAAKMAGDFDKDPSFHHFPRGCCGDASDLLARFLFANGISTYYVCGIYNGDSSEYDQSHAWLQTDNYTIIDITGDQFKNSPIFYNYCNPVYVGKGDDFHRLFEIEDSYTYKSDSLDALDDVSQLRLVDLYFKINKYI